MIKMPETGGVSSRAMRTPFSVCSSIILAAAVAKADDAAQSIPLWSGGAPGFEVRRDEPERAESYWVKNIHNPSITAFLPAPEKATGAAVLVCPGGGHRELVYNAEGREPAEYLAKMGVAAFVLKYRLCREAGSLYDLKLHPREDAQRALRLIRSRANEWKIDPNRIGVLGFSAGGEVVSMVAYESGEGNAEAADPIDRLSARVDFQMLVYPGPLGIPESLPKDAPPAFLLVANDDGAANVVTGLVQKYRAARRPVEVHILARGGHAFNMGNRSRLVAVKTWPQRMADWMNDNDILDPSQNEIRPGESLNDISRKLRDRGISLEEATPAIAPSDNAVVVTYYRVSRTNRVEDALILVAKSKKGEDNYVIEEIFWDVDWINNFVPKTKQKTNHQSVSKVLISDLTLPIPKRPRQGPPSDPFSDKP